MMAQWMDLPLPDVEAQVGSLNFLKKAATTADTAKTLAFFGLRSCANDHWHSGECVSRRCARLDRFQRRHRRGVALSVTVPIGAAPVACA